MNLSEDTWLVSHQQRQTAGAPSQFMARCQTALGRLATAWVSRRQRVRDAQTLLGFSDRELRDLRLSRSDFMGIVHGI